MYKKVYVEITNNCNLSCSFCPHNKRENKFISIDEFKIILDKLEGYTKYMYFHVLGEPLLHPNINELIDIASRRYNINITTNGYLIDRIKDNTTIRQVNISLHSFNGNISLDRYMNNIFEAVDKLSNYSYISLRLWTNSPYTKEIINYLNTHYNVNISNIETMKIANNIYLDTAEEFVWPNLDNELDCENGTCYALKDHIGILVDGTIVPCCLDCDGVIKLGNIYENNLDEIINSDRYTMMLSNFKNNKKIEELCKHCNFNKVKGN